MISAKYNKVIVLEEDEATPIVKAVVIFDEKTHTPVFYGVDKCGMDDILELFGGSKIINNLKENE